MSFHYGVPPEHYTKFYDSSSPYNSSGEYVQYVPAGFHSTPVRRHSRRSSHAESPRVGGWYSPAGSPPPHYDAYVHSVSPRKEAYVSYEPRPAGYSMPASQSRRSKHTRKPSQPIRIVHDDGVEYAEPQVQYIYRDQKPKPKPRHSKKPSTDSYFYYGQEQIYDEQPRRSRARASTNSKPSPQKQRASYIPPRQATEDDAARAGIKPGFSTKNWDPSEKPITLLGSVFDANSLGKWVYDWTVYHHGASTPMSDMAGDLWLLLIKLAGKMKRAEESVRRVRNLDSRDMIDDFLSSGRRLWDKFKDLLKDCEYYMMKAAKRAGTKTMGKNAGTEFVDSIFGRDRYLETTEKIMNNIRLWNMRFDVNCEDILRRPSAA